MADILQLRPHEKMTVKEALDYCARNYDDYQDVIIIGYDADGAVNIRSSHMNRADATFILLGAIDKIRRGE